MSKSQEVEKHHLHQIKYPRGVTVNFRKLERNALLRILRFYGVVPKADLTDSELASLTAKEFHAATVAEKDVVEKFSAKFISSSGQPSGINKKRVPSSREMLDSTPARQGEQVAAKVSKTNENGSWILGNILDFDPNSGCYEVQDEDDVSRVMILPFTEVKRLDDSAAYLRRGDEVLAVFPETTSFYRAVVAKNPKATGSGSSPPDIVVRFEDDEDATGKAPARRVPARFVLRRGDVEPEDDDDDNDEDE